MDVGCQLLVLHIYFSSDVELHRLLALLFDRLPGLFNEAASSCQACSCVYIVGNIGPIIRLVFLLRDLGLD